MPLSGPDRLLVRKASRAGPFGRRAITPPKLRFIVVNTGSAPCAIPVATIDPLCRAGTGAALPETLAVRRVELDDSPTLPPGGHLTFELTGQIPGRVGAYGSNVRLLGGDGASLVIPIAVEVPAAALWGIGCMLLGLACLGTINLLAGEGAVSTQLHAALEARQAIDSWLEANPTPRSRDGDIAAMDHEFDTAVAQLSARPPLSVVDHRLTDAATHLTAATTAASALRQVLAGRPRGAAELDDLAHDWADMQSGLQPIMAMAAADPGPPAPGLAGKLEGFLTRYRSHFLLQQVQWISGEMTTQIAGARLAFQAGEGESARQLAIDSRLWLRRSARALNQAMTSYRLAVAQSGSMVVIDAALRARLARDNFAASSRAPILAMLDAASSMLDGNASLEQWAAASQQLNHARVETARAESAAVLTRVKAAVADISAAGSTDDIEQLIEQLQANPDHSLAAKQAGLGRILDLWRAHVASVTDIPTRSRMQATIAQVATLIAAGDLTVIGPPTRTLFDDWAAWVTGLATEATDRIEHQNCLDSFADLERDTAAIEASLRQQPPGPAIADWDRRLDQLHLDMQLHGPDPNIVTHDCKGPLLALGTEANDLSGDILSASIADLQAPSLTRLRLARDSGLASAVAAVEASQNQPRPLDVTLTTPPDQRVVGRTLRFSVGHADPVWGAGVTIAVAFGDDSPPLRLTAEQLRQDNVVAHQYAHPITAHVAVVAAKQFQLDSITPVDTALGAGGANLLIAPSPVSDAQALADDVLNLRFAIALLIALVVYDWRYQSKTAIFGASSFNYVEAFALGFAANAAVANLPGIIAKLAPV
jgi:hypothetical protein